MLGDPLRHGGWFFCRVWSVLFVLVLAGGGVLRCMNANTNGGKKERGGISLWFEAERVTAGSIGCGAYAAFRWFGFASSGSLPLSPSSVMLPRGWCLRLQHG